MAATGTRDSSETSPLKGVAREETRGLQRLLKVHAVIDDIGHKLRLRERLIDAPMIPNPMCCSPLFMNPGMMV